MPYDASDPRHVRKAERKAERAEAGAALFLRTAMSSLEGRAYFLALLERLNVFHTPFTGDAYSTAFNCGVQSIGLMILADIMAYCPDSYVLMMREREDGRRTSPSPSNNGSGGDQPDAGGEHNDESGDDAHSAY